MADNQFLELLEQEKPTILQMLPGDDQASRDRWWALSYEMTKRGDLREVAAKNPLSLINALKKCADWGLVPDGDECFINVYGSEATAEAMYKGMIRRAVEAGAIAHCVGDVIKDGDTIEESVGPQGRVLTHKRAFNAKPSRALIGAYAIFWLPNGLMDFELFEKDDIERVKAAALRNAQRKNKQAGLSPAWQYSEPEMAKKSVLKRGLKRMRGKRDTDAGRRFEALVTEDTRYDIETTGEEPPPDNLPTGSLSAASNDGAKQEPAAAEIKQAHVEVIHDKTSAVGRSSAAGKPAPAATQASPPATVAPAITDAHVEILCRLWRQGHNGKLSGMTDWLMETFEVEDVAELTSEQGTKAAEMMQDNG